MSALPERHTPYQTRRQQREADTLGLHVFLASEIMMFGGLFAVILACRITAPAAFVAASMRLDLWIATANTVILLTSSLFAALAVEAAQQPERRRTLIYLGTTIGLGLLFLVLKAIEYHQDIAEALIPDPARVDAPTLHFLSLYYLATGLHAVHMVVGVAIFGGIFIAIARRRGFLPASAITVETAALYWHFVDVVWVFLFPALYLARN